MLLKTKDIVRKIVLLFRLLPYFIYNPLYLYFYLKNIPRNFWKLRAKELKEDFFKNKSVSLKLKIWAYKRGFLSKRVAFYGLNENNYKQYMSDLQFFNRKSLKNFTFREWYNNKVSTYYILQPFSDHLPAHYYYVSKKKIVSLGGKTLTADVNGIISLLKEKNELACKKSDGLQGQGFSKLSYSDNVFYINDKSVSYDYLKSYFTGLDGYIITEYVHCNKQLKRINTNSPNTIRLITIFDNNNGAQITSAAISFGTAKTGPVEWTKNQTLVCGVRLESGDIYDPLLITNEKHIPCLSHPDSKESIEGTVPNWGLIKKNILIISNYLSVTPYLTYDVVSTDEGFKILEINSHGRVFIIQYYYPFFQNEYQKKLFSE